MVTVIGILVGAIIIALIWMCVYFNQEIHDVMAEMRARAGGYYKTPYTNENYKSSHLEFITKAELDEWKQKYDEMKIAYDDLAKENDELNDELQAELYKERYGIEPVEEDDDD